MSDTTPLFKSTDKPAPSTNAPGKSRSETTLPSTGKAAPGASSSNVEKQNMAVAIFLFFVVASVLVFVLVMWTGRLDKAIETWRAIRPTLLVFIIVAGGALFILLRSIEKDAEVDAVSTAEADATPVQRIPGNYSAAECIQSTTGLVVVIHTDEGYIRFDAEPLLQSPALWSVDRSRMARWIDRPQNLIKQPLQS